MNLAKPNDLLSIMSSNGKENNETLEKLFHNYFKEKHSTRDVTEAL